jgi:hypothetical protein
MKHCKAAGRMRANAIKLLCDNDLRIWVGLANQSWRIKRFCNEYYFVSKVIGPKKDSHTVAVC